MDTALEHILVSSLKEGMLRHMESHPEAFDEAIRLALTDRQPHAWRAAWLLWSCLEENDSRLRGYIKKIIDTLPTKPDNHQRELLKLLLPMELDEEDEGYLFDLCLNLWEKVSKEPSIRLTALKIIIKIARNHPELLQEVIPLTQNHFLDNLSAGARRAVYRQVKLLTKNP